jgi:hypothetical protein
MKKVRAKFDCTGEGYKNFKKGKERSLNTAVANKLLKVGFVEEVKEETNVPDKEVESEVKAADKKTAKEKK